MSDYEKLVATAEQCGLKLISDDFCCKLLAWVYAFGAETEMITYNVKLRTDISSAQKRLNIFGGEIPDKELSEKLRGYIKECGDYVVAKGRGELEYAKENGYRLVPEGENAPRQLTGDCKITIKG